MNLASKFTDNPQAQVTMFQFIKIETMVVSKSCSKVQGRHTMDKLESKFMTYDKLVNINVSQHGQDDIFRCNENNTTSFTSLEMVQSIYKSQTLGPTSKKMNSRQMLSCSFNAGSFLHRSLAIKRLKQFLVLFQILKNLPKNMIIDTIGPDQPPILRSMS